MVPSDPKVTFGEKVRAARAKSGLNKTSFAERMDVDPQTITRWEDQKHEPKRAQKRRYEKALDEILSGGAPGIAESVRDATIAYGEPAARIASADEAEDVLLGMQEDLVGHETDVLRLLRWIREQRQGRL